MTRKIMIPIMLITFLFGCGIQPLMAIYNRDIMIGGIPLFIIGMLVISGLLVAEAMILFIAERGNDRQEEK